MTAKILQRWYNIGLAYKIQRSHQLCKPINIIKVELEFTSGKRKEKKRKKETKGTKTNNGA